MACMFAPALVVLYFLLYLLPTLITAMRKVDRKAGIILLNLLLGWTGVGWLLSLIWACVAETKHQKMYREMAERQLSSAATNIRPVPQASASLSAGRLIGTVVGRFRRNPDPPPSIR